MDNRRARRAVSDVVSFTLIFSLVAVTVAVVYVGGLSAVEDTRNAERFDNAERAFDVLADNIEDISQDGAPSRATEMKLADSSIGYDNQTTVNVTINNVPGSVANRSQELSLEPIRYTTTGRESELVYESGAVVRTDRGGSVMLQDPPFLFTEDGTTRSALVPIVQTRSTGSAGVGGDSTILVRADLAVRESLVARTTPDPGDLTAGSAYNVTLRIDTTAARAPVWRDHLEARIPDTFNVNANACEVVGGDTVRCIVAVEELFVSVSRIETEFE